MTRTWKKARAFSNLFIAAIVTAIPLAAAWQVEVVDIGAPGKYTSMKIDKSGNLHVAYVPEGMGNPLKYAFRDRRLQRWFTMVVDERSAGACSMVLDSQQHPHIAYTDYGSASGSKLRYAHWNGKSWDKEAIRLSSDIIAYYNSIALGPNDDPRISFYEYRGPKDSEVRIRLRTVMREGDQWVARTVDPEEGSGKFNSMAADALGRMHLAYANVTTGDIRYAFWNGATWTRENVETQQQAGAYVGYSTAITLDKEGNPHICYMDTNTPLLKYAVRKKDRWVIQPVDRLAAVGYPDRNSIVVDEEGHPFITYYDAGRSTLKIAYSDGTNWYSGVVDKGGGFTSSVQVSGGEVWISYADEAGAALKVAYTDVRDLLEHSPALADKSPAQARK
jgi:hypothetical protein